MSIFVSVCRSVRHTGMTSRDVRTVQAPVSSENCQQSGVVASIEIVMFAICPSVCLSVDLSVLFCAGCWGVTSRRLIICRLFKLTPTK